MKTVSSTLKKGSAVLLLLAGLVTTVAEAQGNRNRQQPESSRRDGGTRQSTYRDRPSGNTGQFQRQPRVDNSPRERAADALGINRNRDNNNSPRERAAEVINRRPDYNNNNNNPPVVRNNDNNRRPDYNRGNNGNWNNNNRRPDYNRGNWSNNGNRGYNRPYPGNYGRSPRYNAYNPSWRYANLPRRNTVYTSINSSFLTINFGGYGYRYNNGIFYRPYNNVYTVCAPPIGIHINVLPIGYRRIYVNDYPYYYYNGTYYDYRDNNYTVVSPPVGAIVESIPDGYETVVIDGETYYTVDGAQYKPVVQDNGEIWYEVIKAN